MVNITHTKLDAFALLDMLPVGVVVHSPDTRILHANKKALAVLRLTADQALGKEIMDFQWRVVDSQQLSGLGRLQRPEVGHHHKAGVHQIVHATGAHLLAVFECAQHDKCGLHVPLGARSKSL